MKYYIIAGEASGDLHGANLMRALLQKDPAAEFRFWGGDAMAAIGGTPVRHIRDLAIMGFVEVVAHLRTVLGNIALCKKDIEQWRPDVVVGIDYPGFNLKIEAWAHKQGYKTLHYISPNLWAWKKGRIRGMRNTLDRLCYILPFEEQFFAENDMPQAVYVGHPLLDAIANHQLSNPHLTLKADKPIVALLPGSRRQELKNSLPQMVRLANNHRDYRFVVAGMSLLGESQYRKYIPASSTIEVVYDQTYSLLSQAHAAIVCSGTATLETALFNVPQVVCYETPLPRLMGWLRKKILKVKYISLVNLIVDREIVQELVADRMTKENIIQCLGDILPGGKARQQMLDDYEEMNRVLGGAGASRKAAEEMEKCINSQL